MSDLLVGFDSAWTPGNCGALAGALRTESGELQELGLPEVTNFDEAAERIISWQLKHRPVRTVVMLDQPTIVKNATGQRGVENIVASPVSRRYSGVQPAYTGREEMFGANAPVWAFLEQFGGPADPLAPVKSVVHETYPVLSLIALGWIQPDDARPTGRLPKYNPERRATFSIADWRFVCEKLERTLRNYGLKELANWVESLGQKSSPNKQDQDGIDACICLLVAVLVGTPRRCMMIGNLQSGYIVVPHQEDLHAEMSERCRNTARSPTDWIRLL